ncbi:MAG TPA: hypothetical protein VGN64_07675, partial [Dyadobacter sp.]|nr:hypothetical protein [Dyadobacter sp.]
MAIFNITSRDKSNCTPVKGALILNDQTVQISRSSPQFIRHSHIFNKKSTNTVPKRRRLVRKRKILGFYLKVGKEIILRY